MADAEQLTRTRLSECFRTRLRQDVHFMLFMYYYKYSSNTYRLTHSAA